MIAARRKWVLMDAAAIVVGYGGAALLAAQVIQVQRVPDFWGVFLVALVGTIWIPLRAAPVVERFCDPQVREELAATRLEPRSFLKQTLVVKVFEPAVLPGLLLAFGAAIGMAVAGYRSADEALVLLLLLSAPERTMGALFRQVRLRSRRGALVGGLPFLVTAVRHVVEPLALVYGALFLYSLVAPFTFYSYFAVILACVAVAHGVGLWSLRREWKKLVGEYFAAGE